MKKILVVLLILSVAGGVFAQEGTWSLSTSAWIGTRIDFDPNPAVDDDPALISAVGYHQPYHWWGPVRGNVGIGYTRDAINIALDFDTRGFIMSTATASGDNYRFVIGGAINSWFDASTASASTNNDSAIGGEPRIKRLWGEYKMLNDMVTLLVAYRGPDTMYWVSDDTGALLDDSVNATSALGGHTRRGHYLFGHGNSGVGNGQTFTKVDGHNYLLADFGFAGLNFGMFIPGVFSESYNTNGGFGNFAAGDRAELVDDVLKASVFGAKFSMSPIEFAAQFRFSDYGIYVGGKFFAGPITAGLSFMGILNDPGNSRTMKFGGKINYNAGAFGAGVQAWYRNHRADNDIAQDYRTVVGIEPNFFFNVIPTHLRFELDAGFYFNNKYNVDSSLDTKDVVWAVQPQLFWNFRGTGAGSIWGISTGIAGRYRIISENVNALDIIFRFSL